MLSFSGEGSLPTHSANITETAMQNHPLSPSFGVSSPFRTSLLLAFLMASVLALSSPRDSGAFDIRTISPSGEVKEARQIRVTFSTAVIPFGDFRKRSDDVAEVRCAGPEGIDLKGSPSWEDPTTWVYDFPGDLPAGVRCELKWKSSLRALDGSPLKTSEPMAEFHTGEGIPHVAFPYPGSRIPNDSVFLLAFDAKVDPKEVLKKSELQIEGENRGAELTLVSDPVARAVIRERGPWEWRRFIDGTGKLSNADRGRALAHLPTLIVLRPKLRLPDGKKIQLVVHPGLRIGAVASRAENTFPFETRAPFEIHFNCERETAELPCIPISALSLRFSDGDRQVPWKQAKEIRLVTAGKRYAPVAPRKDFSDDDAVGNVTFPSPLPELTNFQIELPKNFRDEDGDAPRNLASFPLAVKTHAYPPLVKFAARFGIIEAGSGAALPVTVRNVERDLRPHIARYARIAPKEFATWLARVGQQDREVEGRGKSLFRSGDPRVESTILPREIEKTFEVLGIPLVRPGFYVVEVESTLLGSLLIGKPRPAFVSAAALVTNLGVHWKIGNGENALVWVTALDTGRPVAGAKVEVHICGGEPLVRGDTDANGIVRIEKAPRPSRTCRDPDTSFVVSATKGDDFSFVRGDWTQGIEPWRFNVASAYGASPYGESANASIAHTVFDRVLLRAGETVSMKHYLRETTLTGLRTPERFPKILRITHEGSEGEAGERVDFPLAWRKDGTAVTTWKIPAEAKLGSYTTELVDPYPKKNSAAQESPSLPSGKFRVQEFRVPILRATLKVPTEPVVRAESIPLGVQLAYLAGGPASREKAIVRYQASVVPEPKFGNFEDYTFGNGSVDTRSRKESEEGDEGATDESLVYTGQKKSIDLDAAGGASVRLDGIPTTDRIRSLRVELEYRDPNGETQMSAETIPMYPANRLVGIRTDAWMSTKDKFGYWLAVTDLAGNAVRNAEVASDLIERRSTTHRKKIVGGVYAYENRVEWKRLGSFCRGRTDADGRLRCEEKVPPSGGNLYIEASTKDDAGNRAVANQSTWIAAEEGEGWWFEQNDSDRIDLLPLKKRVEPGEMAQFQVRMPFANATALVTVERSGILDAFVTELDRAHPILSVPIRDTYAPNVFVSALVVRGRLGEPAPTAIVDLGKPAYKMGLSNLDVGWSAHELRVTVKPDRDIVRVREKLRVRFRVEVPKGSSVLRSPELAVAVVDEGLLGLRPNESWKLLPAMMHERSHGVSTATNQMHVVGKRHFGVKALPTGGDGGRAITRELFSTLLYWNPSVAVASDGTAEVEVPVNDSLSSFRIAAIASDGKERFGTGEGSFRATQDLLIAPAVPARARRGDHLSLGFTVRNAGTFPVDAIATFRVESDLKGGGDEKINLAPGESKRLTYPIDIPAESRNGADALRVSLTVRDGTAKVLDSISLPISILAAIPVTTLQATLLSLDSPKKLPAESPTDALPGSASIVVSGTSSLLGGLDAMKAKMESYPYDCLEQRLSKAVALADRARWDEAMRVLPNYFDENGLLRYFPDHAMDGSEDLNIYLLRMADEMGWTIPDADRTRALDGLTRFAEGKIVLRTLDRNDGGSGVRGLNRVAAYEAISRFRVPATGLVLALPFSSAGTPVESLIDWWELLHRLGGASPEVLRRLSLAERSLRAKLVYRGTRVALSEPSSPWPMGSEDTAALRLFVLALKHPTAWKEDLGKMARGMLERQVSGAWWNTVANAWGRIAYLKFTSTVETKSVTGTTTVGMSSADAPPPAPVTWSWTKDAHPVATFAHLAGPRTISLSHSGQGRPWITVQSRAAVLLNHSVQRGFRIEKQVLPIEVKDRTHASVGDLYRVDLTVDADNEQTWVVVEDPVPTGSTLLGSGLANESSLLSSGRTTESDPPTFEEKTSTAYRAYFRNLPKGKTKLTYVYRVNGAGHGTLPPTHAEAMYSPEIRGDIPNAPWDTR